MLKLFLALNFLLLNLLACKGGYQSCKLKIIDSKSIKNQTLQIPVSGNKLLLFSKIPPKTKILKADPFLSLYLIQDSKKFRYPFQINNQLSLGVASVDEKKALEGEITKQQVGLNSFASFSEPISFPALLLDSCCDLEGIITPEGIIQKEYIERFLKTKETHYGDIGIRVEDKKGCVSVETINPFIKTNPFKPGDCIIEFDDKEVKTAGVLMRKILFSKLGSAHTIKLKRDKKILTFRVKTSDRKGGGYLSDTFLEFLGLSFDENLFITKIEEKAKKYELRLGDKLLQINRKDIVNREDMLKMISQSKDVSHLLFEREEFQFFIRVN
ncbi:MAG: PDZ domain-containing protein [Campylobacterota bacterium]|nr:PDZ domain-containing protein [Campylobacterota bacterium]